ncbi:L-sorbosone dehydrogenase, putative [Solidesulfovibrio carbinoliphilus subsp. oakridgensis]|uniref:L-sorbosone dehydrogenase, putative n=1 Tax=Solidesulfovibrio carbinoliphilus subsp. oakridgensis TaxID=694327 RepID=G7QC08_9BACT|nr:PQQ-dependent sugar dehydrogenase [Solidesulfovibrio carbinoliphilus]EHJ46043.1 L-sorbosone dehydrogenase, putative [Solidesulfovibrio carbinoliphilus subsp. oakridgensis]
MPYRQTRTAARPGPWSLAALALCCAMLAGFGPAYCARPDLASIRLPPGFAIEVYAPVPGARSMARGAKGTVFVGTRDEGKVYAVSGPDPAHRTVRVIASGLTEPNGVAFKDGDLYVAALDKIYRLRDIESRLDNPPKPESVPVRLPSDRHHGWKYIAFGPDGRLYVPVGAPCNICPRKDPYAAILRLDAATGGQEVFARGIRNTVGFDWHPETRELWFTENGRDRLGDDVPPDSLNRAPAPGLDFGFPFCNAGTPDPEYGQGADCSRYAKNAAHIQAHSAALGMKFYTGAMFPREYRNRIFLAEHGSWNRSSPVGYQVSTATLAPDGTARVEPFATGWLKGRSAWGRPVDVLVMPDGALLVSDDRAGLLYRITYE